MFDRRVVFDRRCLTRRACKIMGVWPAVGRFGQSLRRPSMWCLCVFVCVRAHARAWVRGCARFVRDLRCDVRRRAGHTMSGVWPAVTRPLTRSVGLRAARQSCVCARARARARGRACVRSCACVCVLVRVCARSCVRVLVCARGFFCLGGWEGGGSGVGGGAIFFSNACLCARVQAHQAPSLHSFARTRG